MSQQIRLTWIPVFLALQACGSTGTTRPDAAVQRALHESRELAAQGKPDEALAQLQSALSAYPENLELRAYTIHQRDLRASRLLREADLLREKGRLEEASRLYVRVQGLIGDDSRVADGMRLIARARSNQSALASVDAMVVREEWAPALQAVREVLASDPSNARARELYEVIEKRRSAPPPLSGKLKSSLSRKVTLQFKEAPLGMVLDVIHKIAGINFTYDKDVAADQRISILVKDAVVEEALKVLLSTHHLARKVLNDSTLLIYPEGKAREHVGQVVRSFYLSNTSAKQMSNLIRSVAKAKDFHIDETLNLLVVRDSPDVIALIEKLIVAQDLAEPEVMLEVEVMEVNRKQLEAVGIRWPTQIGLGVRGVTPATDSTGTVLTPGKLSLSELRSFNSNLGVFSITDPALLINMLQSDTQTNLLANPHIRVKSREKAKVHIGDRIPVITSTANSTGFVSESVSYLDIGIKLDVEPFVQLNDEVSIKVTLEVSNQTDQVKTTSGTLTYTIGTRNASTVLRLRNGETQVLAGLFRDDSQEIRDSAPGLASIPIIGRLFSNRDTDRRKKEIVLLITPRVLRNVVPPPSTYTSFAAGSDPLAGGSAAGIVSAEPAVQVAPQAGNAQEATPADKIPQMPNTNAR